MDVCRRAALQSQSTLGKEEAARGRREETAAFKAQHRVFSGRERGYVRVCVCARALEHQPVWPVYSSPSLQSIQ